MGDAGVVGDGGTAFPTATVQRVMLISIDGLGGSYLERRMSAGNLPNFTALRQWGASTTEARTDFTYTTTLPDHASMLTGRPVSPIEGRAADVNHGYYADGMPAPEETLHNAGNPNLSYVASLFDMAHDHGLRTCLYAGKAKFILFSRSYDARHGAPDSVGADNGRGKVDRCVILENQSSALVATASADMEAGECDFAFVHIPDMDVTGHQSGWGTDAWWNTLDMVDAWVGQLAQVARPGSSPQWGLVLTADHGGIDYGHSDPTLYVDYSIPFFAVSPAIEPGTDLYALASGLRVYPGESRPDYLDPQQPIRNLDAADAVLSMLGLGSLPGSFAHGLLRGQD